MPGRKRNRRGSPNSDLKDATDTAISGSRDLGQLPEVLKRKIYVIIYWTTLLRTYLLWRK